MPINLTIFDCTSGGAGWNDTFINIPKFGRISTVAVASFTGLSAFFASFYLVKTTLLFSSVFGLAGVGAVFITKIFLDCFIKKPVKKIDEVEILEVKKELLKRSFCTEESYEEVSNSGEEQIARRLQEVPISSDDFVPEVRRSRKRSPREEKSEKNSPPKRNSPKVADIFGQL